MTETIKAIDLCCGAGGWACAARGLPIKIVAAVDIWEVACQTYRLNHPATRVLHLDLRDQRTRDLIRDTYPTVDLVLGGIPCEWLSIRRNVGNAPGAEEIAAERATLAAVLDLVDALRPAWWCLEDVKGLAAELPPGTPWIELDAADFSPQRRKRIYVGRFPRPTGYGELIGRANAETMGSRLRPGPYRIGKRTFGRKPVTSNAFAPDKCYAQPGDRKSLTICCASSRRDAEYVILDDRLPGGMRQIEWQEAAALQGFPADYLFYGSPTDVWFQLGRAVQIETAHAILRGIVSDAERRLDTLPTVAAIGGRA